jgi:hypothetical protein
MSPVEVDARWHHGQTLAAGQVAEFMVWAELVRQSLGGLHVFLPLRDLGIDGVLHRLSDGEYFAIQVKARTELTAAGQVHITVTESSLVDEDALIIATLIDGAQLGSMVMVVDEGTFRAQAAHDVVDGREYLTAAFEMHTGGSSRWAPYLVSRERLAERFGAVAAAARMGDLEVDASNVDRAREGFLGEAEVIRRLAEGYSLALFRPFPDLETVEVLARRAAGGRFIGLQVKTAGWDSGGTESRIYVRRSSFRPAPSTYVCILGWHRTAHQFSDDCLLMPSVAIKGIAREEGNWLVLELEPGSLRHRRLDAYRLRLSELSRAVESKLA